MPYRIDEARQAGLTDAQISEHLASKSGYKLANARASGLTDGAIIAHLMQSSAERPAFVPSGDPLTEQFGVADAALHVGSQMGAALGGGLTYLGATGARLMQGDSYADADAAGQHVMRATSDALTYQPRTRIGQALSGGADTLLSLPARGANSMGAAVARWTDSPAAGSAANVSVNAALAAVGFRAVRAPVGRTIARTARGVGGIPRKVLSSAQNALQATSPEARLLQTRPTERIQQENAAAAAAAARELADADGVTPSAVAQAPDAPAVAAAEPVGPWGVAPQGPRAPGIGTRALGIARGVGAAFTDPLTIAGSERAALQMMMRFGMRPEDFAQLSDAPTSLGARLTVPEQLPKSSVQSATGASRLLDSLSQDPQTAGMLTARRTENTAVRNRALSTLAGEEGQLAAAISERARVTQPMYEAALAENISPSAMTAAELDGLNALLDRPSIKAAISGASRNFADRGITADPRYSVRALHEAKTILDSMISNKAAQTPEAASITFGLEAMRHARRDLIAAIESHSSGYRTARETFARMSRPVNQFQVGAELARRSHGAENLAGDPSLMPGALRQAVQPLNQPATLSRAIGRGHAKRLDQVMEPRQMQTLSSIVAEISRLDAVDRAGKGSGSPTAQRLIAENLKNAIVADLDQSHPAVQALVNAGVGGVRGSLGVIELASGPLDARIRNTLADLMLNPGRARAAFDRATPKRAAEAKQPPAGTGVRLSDIVPREPEPPTTPAPPRPSSRVSRQRGAVGVDISELYRHRGRAGNSTMGELSRLPQGPFSRDYPTQSAEGNGRLTTDQDGRPISDSAVVVGRRTAGGPDVGLTEGETRALVERAHGTIRAVAQSEMPNRKAIGSYNTDTREIKLLRSLTDEEAEAVLAHETGHMLDTTARDWQKLRPIQAELDMIYQDLNEGLVRPAKTLPSESPRIGWTNPKNYGYKPRDVRDEFIAEAFRAYLEDPNYIKTKAPRTAAAIRERLNGSPYWRQLIHFNGFVGAAYLFNQYLSQQQPESQ